jgi:uncharacterized protein YqeY
MAAITETDPVDLLRARLSAGLREAMKTRDDAGIKAHRSLLGALDNATAVEETSEHVEVFGRSGDVPRRLVTIEEARSLLQRESEDRAAAAAEYEHHGRPAEAAALRAQLVVIARYLDA